MNAMYRPDTRATRTQTRIVHCTYGWRFAGTLYIKTSNAATPSPFVGISLRLLARDKTHLCAVSAYAPQGCT